MMALGVAIGVGVSLLPNDAAARMPRKEPKVQQCAAEDIHGVWRLVKIFTPRPSKVTKAFRANPEEYLALYPSRLVARATRNKPFPSDLALIETLKKSEKSTREQYVPGDRSMIYFYQNRRLDYVMDCGIVIRKQGKLILPGSMLLKMTKRPPGKELWYLYHRANVPLEVKPIPARTDKDAKTKKKKP